LFPCALAACYHALRDIAYRAERKFGTFSALDACNFALNIYDQGDTLSIVCDTGEHGTHVAGITAACHGDNGAFNGVAPGAQARRFPLHGGERRTCNVASYIASVATHAAHAHVQSTVSPGRSGHAAVRHKLVLLAAARVVYCASTDSSDATLPAQIVSCKIGDTRLKGMESGPGLVRALGAVLDNGCDVINMSYGEPTMTPDAGRFIELVNVRILTVRRTLLLLQRASALGNASRAWCASRARSAPCSITAATSSTGQKRTRRHSSVLQHDSRLCAAMESS
jgi:Subtilase family